MPLNDSVIMLDNNQTEPHSSAELVIIISYLTKQSYGYVAILAIFEIYNIYSRIKANTLS